MFKKKRPETTRPEQDILRCSFCNKSQDDVRKLIAGPAVFICDECVDVCKDMMTDDSGRASDAANVTKPQAQGATAGLAFPCALCGMSTLAEDGLVIRNRGILCPGCVLEIETATAQRKPQES